MQQIIVDLIVAAAVLFLLRWLYKGFISRPKDKSPSCGSCPQCGTTPSGTEQRSSAAAAEFRG